MRIASLVTLTLSLWRCGDGYEALGPASNPPATPTADEMPATPTDRDEPTPAPEPEPQPAAPPVVLMHGMAGFAEVGGLTYFNGVADELAAAGYQVFATEVDPFNTVQLRAAQAAVQIDEIFARTGALKVHLIAHSQGGLDARWLIAHLGFGDRVATLTTISTPHHGSKMTDAALGLVPGFATAASAAVADLFAGWFTGTDADLEAQIRGMSRTFVENEFNPSTPNDPRVLYFSYAGATQPWPWVDISTTDIVNPAMLGSYWVIDAIEGANDGLVSVESATWGTFLGVMPADHGDEVGQFPLLSQPAFEHLAFYRGLAAFLYGTGPAPIF